MFTKEAQDNLAKYLLGLNCDKQQLMMDLRNMNRRVDITYTGYVFRGMYFNHVIEKSEIHNQMVCSWSTDIEVAEQFASHGRFPVILVKKSNGYSVLKIIDHLRENNQLVSERLTKCSSKYEKEVLDELDVCKCSILTNI